MTHKPYVSFIMRQHNGNALDWDAAELYAMAVSNAYVPDRETHDFKDDVVANEVVGTNWAAGGQPLGARTVTYDSGTRQVRLLGGPQISVADVVMTGIRYFVVYDRVSAGSTDAVRPLISVIDLEADEDVDGTLSITWDATGVGRFVLPA